MMIILQYKPCKVITIDLQTSKIARNELKAELLSVINEIWNRMIKWGSR